MAPAGASGSSERGDGRWTLGSAAGAVDRRLARWTEQQAARQVWAKDPALWPQAPATDVTSRLGWLLAPEQGRALLGELSELREGVARDGFERVVLFGMGGSSLAAEVMAELLPRRPGAPAFEVLDSTHPARVRACLDSTARTLFVVSSKSGTTLEPNAFFRTAWERVAKDGRDPGRSFVAITDPGTPLETLARDHRFRACFPAPPDVGGRYSALTVFGLVPATLAGVDLAPVLDSAAAMAARCGPTTDAAGNPGLRLGATLGELARAGHDKVVFLPSPALRAFPAWAEQLVAESLGKIGRGIVPIGDPPPVAELPAGRDAVYVRIQLTGESDPALDAALTAREAAGLPVLRFQLAARPELGAEFFRWEFAIAACGAVVEVDPFDQPDVEHAKELARAAMGAGAAARTSEPYGIGEGTPELARALRAWSGDVHAGDYVAVQAFLAPTPPTTAALEQLVSALRRRLGVVVALGYGPRFLHSTGQLHKGGPPSGVFLQIVDEPTVELPVPEMSLTFGQIIRAQARGDRGALEEHRRRLAVVNVGRDPVGGVERLVRLLDRAPG